MIFVRISMNPLLEKQLEVMQTLGSMIEPTSMDKGCLSCRVFCVPACGLVFWEKKGANTGTC
jgi:hypothetical protein